MFVQTKVQGGQETPAHIQTQKVNSKEIEISLWLTNEEVSNTAIWGL